LAEIVGSVVYERSEKESLTVKFTDALGELLGSISELAGQFPPVNTSQIPACGFDPVCTRARKYFLKRNRILILTYGSEFFSWFTKRPPVYLPSTTPVYSNAAYQLLGYALENITNKSFESLLDQSIFKPLNMTRSSLLVPSDPSEGVIPVNETTSGWAMDGGEEAP
jgi:CubicO group peptidase (beta-lactamase class C family)